MHKTRKKKKRDLKKMLKRDLVREAEIEAKIRVLYPKKPPPKLSDGHPSSRSWKDLVNDYCPEHERSGVMAMLCIAE